MEMLPRHGSVSIAFTVEAVVNLDTLAVGGNAVAMKEVPVPAPYRKDYDAIQSNDPSSWPFRFDIANWGLLGAYDGTRRIGGAVLAHDTPGLDLLPAKDDALLWDLRVAPDHRRHGVGAALFAAAGAWARRRACARLLVETQDTNPVACRFYAAQGCRLLSIRRGAYPEFPAETQLLWVKSLIEA